MLAVFLVVWKKKVEKQINKLPVNEQKKTTQLIQDLRAIGPIQKEWPNFSDLGEGRYHCHLSYHWVACWKHNKGDALIEIYYVGSRENAPY